MQLTQLRINQQRCGHKSQFDWLLSGGTCIFNLDHTGHKAWFPYRCICRICRTKKNHRTDRIHSISYKKLYVSFLLYRAFVREVSIKLYLSYEFFSYDRHDRHDRYDRYNDMETRLKLTRKSHQKMDFLKTSNANEWCLEAEIELL